MVKLDSTISPHENITAFIYMANCSGFGFKCEHPMHWSAYNIVASKSALLTSAMICDVKFSNNERKISGDFWNSVNSGACADSLYQALSSALGGGAWGRGYANSRYKNLDKTQKLLFRQCYHIFSDSRSVGLLKKYYEP